MLLLIESPKSLMPHWLVDPSKTNVHGANKIAAILLEQCIENTTIDKIIVSDFSDDQCQYMTAKIPKEKKTIISNYTQLMALITRTNNMPDCCINFDADIKRLCYFREVNKLSYPIIGLIHSLGFYSHFKVLEDGRLYLRSYDNLLCPSENTQESVIKTGIKKSQTTVIHYGLDTIKYSPVSDKQALRKSCKIPTEKVVLLALGRLSPSLKMDLSPLCRILPKLIEKTPELLLYIVGEVVDTAYVSKLKKLCQTLGIQDNVIWETNPDQDTIEKYYQVSDAFISLSDCCGETYGLTVMEAMACGLPVIVSNFAGYKTHITPDSDGIYIPTYSADCGLDAPFYTGTNKEFGEQYGQSIACDVTYLENAITTLVQSRKERKKIGDNARKTIENRNTLDRMHQHILDSIKTAISRVKQHPPKSSSIHNIFELFSEQCSTQLTETQVIEITEKTREDLEKNTSIFFFETQLNNYPLIRVILHILSKEPQPIFSLCQQIKASKKNITRHCLFLLKQHLISVVKKERV